MDGAEGGGTEGDHYSMRLGQDCIQGWATVPKSGFFPRGPDEPIVGRMALDYIGDSTIRAFDPGHLQESIQLATGWADEGLIPERFGLPGCLAEEQNRGVNWTDGSDAALGIRDGTIEGARVHLFSLKQ